MTGLNRHLLSTHQLCLPTWPRHVRGEIHRGWSPCPFQLLKIPMTALLSEMKTGFICGLEAVFERCHASL